MSATNASNLYSLSPARAPTLTGVRLQETAALTTKMGTKLDILKSKEQ
jgi:hypothetical protein